jgi:hypothetical protein
MIGIGKVANRLDFAESSGTVVISPGNAMIFFVSRRRYIAARDDHVCSPDATP